MLKIDANMTWLEEEKERKQAVKGWDGVKKEMSEHLTYTKISRQCSKLENKQKWKCAL